MRPEDVAWSMRLADLRISYADHPLDLADLDPDPFQQYQRWLEDARDGGLADPNAVALATVDEHGAPSVRMVLLKGIEAGSLVFYTNLDSRKGRELRADGRCALCSWWSGLERQVRSEGVAELLDDATADAYFASRPRGSQLGAWASPQSRPLEDRSALEARLEETEARFGDGPVPRPPFWGGFRLIPHAFEFWQGRSSRLHDRFRYERLPDDTWKRRRLAP